MLASFARKLNDGGKIGDAEPKAHSCRIRPDKFFNRPLCVGSVRLYLRAARWRRRSARSRHQPASKGLMTTDKRWPACLLCNSSYEPMRKELAVLTKSKLNAEMK